MTDPERTERIFDILGLSLAERKIIVASKMAKRVSALSRATGIPQKSLPYMLSGLGQRGLMKKIGKDHKSVLWMSDMGKALRELSSLERTVRALRAGSPPFGRRARS